MVIVYSSQPQNSQFDVEEGEEHSIFDNNDDRNEDSISDVRGLGVEKV